MAFSIGNIVMLKEPNNYTCTYINKLNLYKVKEVVENGYILNNINEIVANTDVLPVPIDRNHDSKIYYYFIVAANTYLTDEDEVKAKPLTQDMRYYMDAIKEMDDDLYEQVKKLSFVHEVQNVLEDDSDPWNTLKIDNF